MESIADFLRKIVGDKLGIEKNAVDENTAFFTLGITSIISEEILAILYQRYPNIPSTLLFEYPNINKLSRFLESQERKIEPYQTSIVHNEQTKDLSDNKESTTECLKNTNKNEESILVSAVCDNGSKAKTKSKDKKGYDIAVIGLSGKFPKANDQFEYWKNLINNKDCIEKIPKDRWNYLSFYSEKKSTENTTYSKWGGFIDDVDKFDPLFFCISPLEAELMDPQQKLFLTCCWEAIEDAGYGKAEYRKTRKIGVFAGVTWNEFSLCSHEEGFLQGQYKGPGSLYWSIPNRVSYFLDLTGPSIAIDTACSSSLVAIHQACQAILAGDCELSLAGGVNLNLHPSKYISLSDSNFLSSEGKCRSFGEGGDGYVPGEGVGAVLLKPLEKAIEDGDYIYGVIRGSATNHGGKTTGYTVPNPEAHRELIVTAIERAQIQPEDLTYVECHGTGTALGDPIEVKGLMLAFETYTQKKQFCGIGSVKSNIGHLEAAAGVGALIKVLLSMKYKMLPASIHSEVINHKINFKESPFYVISENQDWGAQGDNSLFAGVSSFGAGGSNAHLIIESYNKNQPQQYTESEQETIMLSAQSQIQLSEYAKKLVAFISEVLEDSLINKEYSLRNIAKTLKNGREVYRYRFATVATSLAELQKNLQSYIYGETDNKNIFTGEVVKSKNLNSRSTAGTTPLKPALLAALWVKGEIDNDQIRLEEDFLKVPLPTYPFLKEKSWINDNEVLYEKKILHSSDMVLHPLVDANISTHKNGRFKKAFSKYEYFLKDHLINNNYVLPGVSHLEIAAISGSIWRAQGIKKIKDLWFMHPITVGENLEEVEIEFESAEDDNLQFTIKSANREELLFSQGKISYSPNDPSIKEESLSNLDLIKSSFNKHTDFDEFYRLFARIGIVQKTSFQVIRQYLFNNSEAFSKITLQPELEHDFLRYRLHPTLMDGAIQTAMAQVLLSQNQPSLIVPFHIGELRILKPLTTTIYAHTVKDSALANQFNITIYDNQGRVAVEIKDFIVKEVKNSNNFSFSTEVGPVLFQPCWKEQVIEHVCGKDTVPYYEEHLVILDAFSKGFKASIEASISGIAQRHRCLILQSQKNNKAQFLSYATQIFDEIQSILRNKPRGKVLIQIVIPKKGEHQVFSGIYGLLKTAQLENPKIIGQLIEVESGESSNEIVNKLKENSLILAERQIRYQNGKRFVAEWSEVEVSLGEENLPWKDGGIYLITGGAGGLGLIFAKEIARKAKNVTLILTGRSTLNEDKQINLNDLDARVEYRQVDVTEQQAVENLIKSIQEDFGCLNGIIHSAGVIKDNFIIKKTKEEFLAVLAPKVTGLINLDRVTQNIPIDFFVLFSSISGTLGNPGQSDYSTANTFMDAYAKYRNDLVMSKQRHGKTLAINWPLWKEGGMHVDEEVEKRMKETMDIVPMQTRTGIWALYQGLVSGQSQVLVMEGNVSGIKQKLISLTSDFSEFEVTEESEILKKQNHIEAEKTLLKLDGQNIVTTTSQDKLHEKAINYIKIQLSSVIKIPVHRIEANAPFEKYGIDSIMSMKLTNQLEKTFGSLPKTLFFEYQNIKELTEYFINFYQDQLIGLLKIENQPAAAIEKYIDIATVQVNSSELQEKVINYIKTQFSSVIKLPVHRIEANAPFEKYGIDSIMSMKLTNQLEKTFASLPKTLFFEYQNINELAGYFIEAYHSQLMDLLKIEEPIVENTQKRIESAAVFNVFSKKSNANFSAGSIEPRKEKLVGALDIAIIGVSGRYPQAKNVEEFWNNLRYGKDCITEIPKERWEHSLYFDEDKNKPGKTYSKWGGFLAGVDQFDPLFFNISPREAEIMDPQERLFLECVYAAIEDAGYTGETLGQQQSFGLKANVGVFVGTMFEEYQLYGVSETMQGRPLALWGVPSSIANRVSYFCNFHGPSMAVDTMCSSSLTSIHLACQSLCRGECELAIAGGVNVLIHPNKYLFLAQGKFLSSSGQCESFGEGGDGYVPGEGVGAVILKPLAKAVADGDHIYGVIKGTAVNHGGKTNGYTVPNPNAQASVIRRAIKEAGIDPRLISYIEAHGTGTSLGDPIEIAGLVKAFQEYTKDRQFCAIGSAKSNIGHCEGAAGIAGITKVLLQLKYHQLAPSLHSDVLNPNINFSDTPFIVQQKLTEWKRPIIEINGEGKEYPRIAGISAFGAGGSNAHVVIEEYIPVNQQCPMIAVDSQNPAIIVLSAKNVERLQERVKEVLAAVQEEQFSDNLADIAYTLQVGREAMETRLGLIVDSIDELVNKLQRFVEGKTDIQDLFYGQVKRNKETMNIFEVDEDLAKVIDTWIDKGKYVKILDLWVKGLNIDWNKFYADIKPRRVSLPTYPFSCDRYWAPKAQGYGQNGLMAVPVTEKRFAERKISIVKKQWEQALTTLNKNLRKNVAILTTQETQELAIKLSEYLPNSFIFNIDKIDSQLQQSDEEWKIYSGCVDLIGCGKDENTSQSWMVWLQHLIEYGNRDGLMLLCVTKGVESYQNSAINLSGASRVGLYRMLQSEYGHLKSRHMDADSLTDNNMLAQQIASEIHMDNEELEVCYRNGQRYRSFLQEEKFKYKETQRIKFPEDQVLLITGGTRGIGYLCARHFVINYGVKKIVLTGREKMPPREQWSFYLQQKTSIAKKIVAIQDLEAQGVQVQVLTVSLTDKYAVQESLQEIKNTMGVIGGVIHCAGNSDSENPAFIRKPLDGIIKVMEPKVKGLDILYQSLKNQPLRFFVLFSSVSSIIPTLGAGQSDYATANAYMNYFAEANISDCPIVSIIWPSWKETGMGEIKSRVYEQTGLFSITNNEGLQLLDYIISEKIGPVVLPAVINPDLWNPQQLMRRKINKVISRDVELPHISDAYADMDTLVMTTQTWLTELFIQELKIKDGQFEKDVPFQDYGVDSVLLAQLLRKINQTLNEDLDTSILFEYSTIELLTAWLVRTHFEALSQALTTLPSHQTIMQSVSEVAAVSSGTQLSLQALPKKEVEGDNSSDIAVVGLSCRFPGANNLNEYWQLVSEGKSAIRAVPEERWGYVNNYYAGLLDNITNFDPKFFKIPIEDAKAMDPQALIALEESLKVWYHAGYSHQEIKGKRIGVYVGARSQHQPDNIDLLKARNPIVAVGPNYLAANISQFFDLRGPSIVIDTACSSALVGMNLAIQALNNGEIESALVGGVSLLTTDTAHRVFQQREILSKEPFFHIFDKRANGVVLGEGVGMVLLKTVEQAIADGDCIYARIKASAVNNDGRTAGPAAPNIEAQRDVMRNALTKSGKKPEEISYIEVNGSGTEVTDLIELKAIQSVYRESKDFTLDLGSIKPNIGHPLCAEGIASFIKVVLMLQHQHFVPFLSGGQPMSHYNMEKSSFNLSKNLTQWMNTPRIAAINCFADGGTNVHMIIEGCEGLDGYEKKRKPISPPQLNRYDIRYDKGLSATVSRPVENNQGAIQNKSVQNPSYEYSKASNTLVNVWKQKIAEE